MKHHWVWSFGALALAALAAAAAPAQAGSRHHGLSISSEGDDATSCDQFRTGHDSGFTARAEQDFTIARGGKLLLRPGENGGIMVRGYDGADYRVKACKFAGGDSDSAAQGSLGRISVASGGGEIRASGPRDDDWEVILLVEAPRNASVDLEAENGPMSMRGVSGTANLTATNGPISLHDCSGQIHAHAENGPISFSGNSGEIQLESINGPVSLHLMGTKWEGGLDARTENGPLSVRIPRGYSSAITLKASGNAPLTCHAEGCKSFSGTWGDEEHEMRFGKGNAVVRLTGGNGPVTVSSENGDRRHHGDGNDRDHDDDEDSD